MNPTVAAMQRFSISKAHEAQTCLSRKIITEDMLPQRINLIAGVDVAYSGSLAIGAVAVLDYESLKLLEWQTATCEVKFPYIPTLLYLRETPPAVACIRKLKLQPDVFLVDAHGVAHPYGCGFASHLGLVTRKPTVGVAKSRLIGEAQEVAGESFMVHDNQIVGAMVKPMDGAKPIYVSVGHMVSLGTAVKIVKHCLRGNRAPQPLLQAHNLAKQARNAFLKAQKT